MTKSYYYIPTHFLYSPLLFFLLIFMHQLTYCHTLSKPFSQIFLFRIYAPTIYSADFELDETSDRLPHISAPIQPPQTNPQRHRPPNLHVHTATQNQSTNDTVPRISTQANPLPQIPRPRCPTSQTTTDTHPHRLTRDAGPPTLTLTLTPSHSTLTQPQPPPIRNWTGQAPDRIRLNQTRPNRIRPGQAIGPASDETSRPASANFSAKPDSGLIRDAIRADAVVDVDAPMLTLILMQVPACWEANWMQV